MPGTQHRVRQALLLSDLHLGWVVCHALHDHLLSHLHEAVDDAELIVLNGDIIDAHRGVIRPDEVELVLRLSELITAWRAEGRRVVYVEGNHDPAPGTGQLLWPETWRFDFVGFHGERIRTVHGHRFSEAPFVQGAYEAVGKHLLRAENRAYARHPSLQTLYGLGPGWLAGVVAQCEDTLWRRSLPTRLRPILADVDTIVHGHFHFGPATSEVDGVPLHKSGAWVSRGQLGSVDRMLRYDRGKFIRLGLEGRRFVVCDDGR